MCSEPSMQNSEQRSQSKSARPLLMDRLGGALDLVKLNFTAKESSSSDTASWRSVGA